MQSIVQLNLAKWKTSNMAIEEGAVKVSLIQWSGQQAIEAESDYLIMRVIPGSGSRVASLWCKEKSTELLRIPDSDEDFAKTPMLYGIPVLFPPNRIEDGKFTYGNHTYQFAINEPATGSHSHGLVHDKAWKTTGMKIVGSAAVITTQFDSSSYPDVLAQFPHPFRLIMRLILDGATLTQMIEVHNESEYAFPWGLGYHTTFRFPFHDDSSEANCTFSAPVGYQWELNDRFLPTGELLEKPQSAQLNAGIVLQGVQLDDLYQAARKGANEAVMTDRDSGIRVRYWADESFGQWVLHNGDSTGGYLCPEPYTCVTNAFNMQLPPELTGMKVLQASESYTVSCAISVEQLEV